MNSLAPKEPLASLVGIRLKFLKLFTAKRKPGIRVVKLSHVFTKVRYDEPARPFLVLSLTGCPGFYDLEEQVGNGGKCLLHDA